ncbi:MAG: galactose mutarotase [Clostridia bacterium]|nr:galactose mutarotase [Clostridia bacterium]
MGSTKIISYDFGKTKKGEKVTAFEMSNDNGMLVRILDYGCTIQSIVVPDSNGGLRDVVLGYDDILSYENGTSYFGAMVGRYANRIADARFVLDGKEYILEKNENNITHLHGVYTTKIFKSRIENNTLIFYYLSFDGEEGYPGNLSIEVKYALGDDNALTISYKATTDAPTIINLTNHSYFNLNGQDGSTILNHILKLNSSYFTECTKALTLTGKILSVDGTPFDFREEKAIGERWNNNHPQFKIGSGYDHNMILDGNEHELKTICILKGDKSGIIMEALTTEPAVQFYSGNFVQCDNVKKGKNGIYYPQNGGVCFEAQHYPDSMNYPQFPSVVLRPNETYTQKTTYRFMVNK